MIDGLFLKFLAWFDEKIQDLICRLEHPCFDLNRAKGVDSITYDATRCALARKAFRRYKRL